MLYRRSPHGQWSSRWVFLLAATGSAVGLGNIWKFPTLMAQHGGSAFLLVYVLCLFLLGGPLMAAELMLGRRGGQNPISSMREIAQEEGRSPHWALIAWVSVAAGFVILSAYSVIGGWTIAYVFRMASGMFRAMDELQAAEAFRELTSDPERLLAWHTIFLLVVVSISARGVREGLEHAVRWLMPLFLALLVLLVGYAATTPNFSDAATFLFRPDFAALDAKAVLAALAYSFFTLTLGVGAMMAYGAYLDRDTPVLPITAWVIVVDTVVAVLAGLAVFPAVFAAGLHPASGPRLIFQLVPVAFSHAPGGVFFGTVLFVVLVLAAWTSAIALLEPGVAYLVERRGLSRLQAAGSLGIVLWFLGIASLLSFNLWQGVRPLRAYAAFERSTIFDLLSFFAANIAMPLVGLAIAIFAGWILQAESNRLAMASGEGSRAFSIWQWLVRITVPLGLVFIGLDLLGGLDMLGNLFR